METLLTDYLPDTFGLASAENGTHWSVQQADNDISLKGKTWLTDFSQQSGLNITPQDSIYIGSQVGDELIDQGGLALITAVIVILLYLSFRFEWRLAAGSVIALCHDVIVVLGLFAWLGIEFDLTIVASLLAIIGYSLNDSIIVGDKIREIMKRNSGASIENIVNLAIKSTIVRTLITSGTTLATIMAIWIFAGESLSGFAISLFTGILIGTFSSITISATVPQLIGLSADYYNKKDEEVCALP
jgi:preprotein translocase subunit SecF